MDFEDLSGLSSNPGDYDALDGRSQGIIDFDAMPGFGFNWRSPLSSRFERSIRLMILPPFPTFGFTYSSRPMVAPSHQEDSKSDEFEGQQGGVDDQRSNPKDHATDLLQKFDESHKNVEDRKQVEEERARLINALQQFGKEHEQKQQQTSKPDNNEIQVQAKEESTTTTTNVAAEETVEEVDGHQDSNFFLSGEVTWDGMVQAMYNHRISQHWQIKNMALSSMDPGRSMLMSSVQYNGASFTSKLGWSSDRNRLNLNILKSITPGLAFGGDVNYTFDEKKPVGYSLGTRYTLKEKGKSSFAETQMTLAYNHLGRVKTTYTTALLPFIFMSARYTVNVHSFRSNTAIGVECWPSEHFPFMVKAKWDTDKGIGFNFGAQLPFVSVMFNVSYNREYGPLAGLFFEL